MDDKGAKDEISRREFLEGTGAAVLIAATAPRLAAQNRGGAAGGGSPAPEERSVPRTRIHLTVNGVARQVEVEDRWTLAELLRDHLRLTGTKLGCERGECGACTVIVNESPVYSCSYLAAWVDGKSVTTVEGLVKNGKLDPLQEAFVAHDGPQCGFCTPGQIMSATALLAHNPHPEPADVRAALAGNLCRCANYNRIVEAVMAVAGSPSPNGRQGGHA